MLPVDAKNCKICGSRKTKHESGICSVCRRRKKARPCIRCGERETVDESGLCSQCRLHLGRKLSSARPLDQAIARESQILMILQMRKSGLSYNEIAKAVELPRSTTYMLACKAMYFSPTELELSAPDMRNEEQFLEQIQRCQEDS